MYWFVIGTVCACTLASVGSGALVCRTSPGAQGAGPGLAFAALGVESLSLASQMEPTGSCPSFPLDSRVRLTVLGTLSCFSYRRLQNLSLLKERLRFGSCSWEAAPAGRRLPETVCTVTSVRPDRARPLPFANKDLMAAVCEGIEE